MIKPHALIAPFLLSSILLTQAEFSDPAWRYQFRQPEKNWQAPGFDDSDWAEGHGGFGRPSTPGSRISTLWNTDEIWIRRTVEWGEIPENPALYIFHDEDAEVFINGKLVASFEGYTTEYLLVPLEYAALQALKPGENLLAVHCRQTTGGQAIDVHLIDAATVPTLPKPKPAEHPFLSKLITEWGAQVTAENAWTEYPRPQMARDQWSNLNGHWDYAFTSLEASRPEGWDGKILVLFPVESKLSGVQRLLHEDKALWYHRELPPTKVAKGKRRLLHFEACDYHTRVWINDQEVGEHTGGSTPFHFDISDALQASQPNHLYVRVEDATGGFQLRGKQPPNPRGIWYTQVSGIWGTVWTEDVPDSHIRHLDLQSLNDGQVTVKADMAGSLGAGAGARVVASLEGETVEAVSKPGFSCDGRTSAI